MAGRKRVYWVVAAIMVGGALGSALSPSFWVQALGLIVGPLIALALLGAGVGDGVAWRKMLALGVEPVIYLRRCIPESPRYEVQVQGRAEEAASQLSQFTRGQVNGNAANTDTSLVSVVAE